MDTSPQGEGRLYTDPSADKARAFFATKRLGLADKLTTVVTRLREMSPLYELAKEGVDLSTMQWQTEGH